MKTIHERARNGEPLNDILIIDEHCHPEWGVGAYQAKGELEDIIKVMDRLGVDKACISPIASLTSDMCWGNDRIIRAVTKYPERFIGYCTINPLYPDMIKPELERCFGVKGFKGIKYHPWSHNRPLSYKNYRIAIEFAARHDLFVMTHTYNPGDVATTAVLAEEFPSVSFIMAHMGGEFPCIEQAVDVLVKHKNVYGDISVSELMEGLVEWYVKETGAKQILYGTDSCCMDATGNFARLAMAEISEEAKKDIFGLNMQGILNKCRL